MVPDPNTQASTWLTGADGTIDLREKVIAISLSCSQCGYDLRGAPAAGQCAECGASIADALSHAIDPVAHRLPSLADPRAVGDGLVAAVWAMTAGILLPFVGLLLIGFAAFMRDAYSPTSTIASLELTSLAATVVVLVAGAAACWCLRPREGGPLYAAARRAVVFLAFGLATAIAVDAEELTTHVATEDDIADPWVVVNENGTVVLGHPLDAIGQPVHQRYPKVSDADIERINVSMHEQPSGYLQISTPPYWVGWTTVAGSPWRLFLPIDMHMILTPVWAAARQAAMIAVVGFVVNLLVIVLVAGLFTKPIRALAAAFRQVRAGALDTRVPVKSRDELGHLAEGFNDMTSQLGGLIDARAKAKVERAAVERELSIAKEMQDSLLPAASSLPNNAVGRVQAKMQPAKEVGGDFFDAWEQRGSIWFTVADVSGKGVGAGLFMAVASTILHGVRKHVDDPGEALCVLNDRLLEDGADRPVFLTMFLGRLDPDGTVTFASAGHLPAIQLGTGEPRIVADATGPPLAMARDMVWTSGTLHMEPGEHLLLYSDGAVEAHYDDGTMVEIEGLAAMVQTALRDGETDVIGGLVQTLTDLQTEGQFDDITLLALTRRAT